MKNKTIVAFVFFTLWCFAQNTGKISAAGINLQQFYLKQKVENLWLAGQHINWETGMPDNPNATKNIKTHCSTFVASVLKQKGIYILRPPKHPQELLANAQFEWLLSEDAYSKDWRQIKDSIYERAQSLANDGFFVIAVYKNPDLKKPGHIALVMPMEKSIDDLRKEGPTLIQAGRVNKNYISLKEGFNSHIKNWYSAKNEILFFYYLLNSNKN